MTDFTPADADSVLALLDRGALDDILTLAARNKLRTAAQAAQCDADEPPTATVVAVTRDRRGVRCVTVACPFCPPNHNGRPRTHTHGWPDDSPEVGHRNAHCAEGRADSRGYRIVLTPRWLSHQRPDDRPADPRLVRPVRAGAALLGGVPAPWLAMEPRPARRAIRIRRVRRRPHSRRHDR